MTMGERYVELQELRRQSVFVGPDGNILDPGSLPARRSRHSSGESSADTFPCPECPKDFVSLAGVQMHLIKSKFTALNAYGTYSIMMYDFSTAHKLSRDDSKRLMKKSKKMALNQRLGLFPPRV